MALFLEYVVGFSELIQHFTNGLSQGSIYALIALGYTMVYGILKLINFAHGEFMMVGTYAGLFTITAFAGSGAGVEVSILLFIVAVVVAILASILVGVGIEKVAYKPLREAPRLAPLLTAIGVSIILTNVMALLMGTKPQKYPYPFINKSIDIFGVAVTPHTILVVVITLMLWIALKLFVEKSRMGKAMRATSLDKDVALLMGINVNRVISLTFAIGSGLAAVAGVLYAMPFKASPSMGLIIGLKAFTAAVFGGIGNITGALIGGLLLGILETFGVAVLGIPSGMRDIISFGILIFILLVKPDGLMGKTQREKV